MRKQVHILNGDALKQNFPGNIQGEILVARECLVDGNVKGENLDEVFAVRAQFISQNYGGSEADYYKKAASEFRRMLEINDDSDINLWFEDDLFCQVNFWFVVDLLLDKDCRFYLVRPVTNKPSGFGGLNKSELISSYQSRMLLTELDKVSNLWRAYQIDDFQSLTATARELEGFLPFILSAVNAHIQRFPANENLGRPTESLTTIIEELGTTEFEVVFKEFNKRESIYGFGDLQVKRLYDDLLNNR